MAKLRNKELEELFPEGFKGSQRNEEQLETSIEFEQLAQALSKIGKKSKKETRAGTIRKLDEDLVPIVERINRDYPLPDKLPPHEGAKGSRILNVLKRKAQKKLGLDSDEKGGISADEMAYLQAQNLVDSGQIDEKEANDLLERVEAFDYEAMPEDLLRMDMRQKALEDIYQGDVKIEKKEYEYSRPYEIFPKKEQVSVDNKSGRQPASDENIKKALKKRAQAGDLKKDLPLKRQEAVRAVRKMREQDIKSQNKRKTLDRARIGLRNRRWALQKTHDQEISKGMKKYTEKFDEYLKNHAAFDFKSFAEAEQKYGIQYAQDRYKDFVKGELYENSDFFYDLDNEIAKLERAENRLMDTSDKLPPKRLGGGVEKTVYDVDGKAVRVPKYGGSAATDNFRIESETLQMLESKGMAPETFHITTKTGNKPPFDKQKTRSYQVQPKMKKDFSDAIDYTTQIRPDLEKSIEYSRDLPMLPEDLHTGNVMLDKQGKPKIIDAGHFQRLDIDDPWLDPEIDEIKPRRVSEAFKERFKKFKIDKKTAGKFRRKLPSVLPWVGTAIGLYSALRSDPTAATEVGENERNAAWYDLLDPVGSVPVAGDLPPSVMKKRTDYNNARKELLQGESLNEPTSNINSGQ